MRRCLRKKNARILLEKRFIFRDFSVIVQKLHDVQK